MVSTLFAQSPSLEAGMHRFATTLLALSTALLWSACSTANKRERVSADSGPVPIDPIDDEPGENESPNDDGGRADVEQPPRECYAPTVIARGPKELHYLVDLDERGRVLVNVDFEREYPKRTAFVWDGARHDLQTPLGFTRISAYAMNARGEVVGTAARGEDDAVVRKAFIWRDGLPAVEIPVEVGSGDLQINAHGHVVGTSRESGADHVFLYRDGKVVDLGPGTGADINNNDDVVGWVRDVERPEFLERPNLFRNGGESVFLGAHGSGGPLALNDGGQIAGVTQHAAAVHRAFFWSGGALSDLGTLGGPTSMTMALNERGDVVGVAEAADRNGHAFLWHGAGMIDLGTLGGSSSAALDINEKRQVVGYFHTKSRSYRPFVWQGGAMKALPLEATADELAHALRINEAGTIAGEARGLESDSDENEFDVNARVLVWTPVECSRVRSD